MALTISSTSHPFMPPPTGWPVCGNQVSHNRQDWLGLVQEEPGRKKNLPTQVLKQSLSCCVTTTCAGYTTQRLTCQETREKSSHSTTGSFQCLACAECLQNKTGMGAQRKKINLYSILSSAELAVCNAVMLLYFMAGQDL